MKIKRASTQWQTNTDYYEPVAWTADTVDEKLMIRVENGKSSPVAWWLMASYLYYRHDISLLKDETFDWLGHWIKNNWTAIKHPNKRLIKKSATFTGYYVKNYPIRVQSAAWQMAGLLGKVPVSKE